MLCNLASGDRLQVFCCCCFFIYMLQCGTVTFYLIQQHNYGNIFDITSASTMTINKIFPTR